MIISTGKEKVFDKIHYPFLVRTLSKLALENNFLIQHISEKPIDYNHSYSK